MESHDHKRALADTAMSKLTGLEKVTDQKEDLGEGISESHRLHRVPCKVLLSGRKNRKFSPLENIKTKRYYVQTIPLDKVASEIALFSRNFSQSSEMSCSVFVW